MEGGPQRAPVEGEPGRGGLGTDTGAAELAVTSVEWAVERYGLSLGNGARFEMYVYVADLDGVVRQLAEAAVPILREPWTRLGGNGSRRSRILRATLLPLSQQVRVRN